MRRLALGAVFLAGCNALFGIDAATEGLFVDAGAKDAGAMDADAEDADAKDAGAKDAGASMREDPVAPPLDAGADTAPRPLGTCIVTSFPTFYVNGPSDLARCGSSWCLAGRTLFGGKVTVRYSVGSTSSHVESMSADGGDLGPPMGSALGDTYFVAFGQSTFDTTAVATQRIPIGEGAGSPALLTDTAPSRFAPVIGGVAVASSNEAIVTYRDEGIFTTGPHYVVLRPEGGVATGRLTASGNASPAWVAPEETYVVVALTSGANPALVVRRVTRLGVAAPDQTIPLQAILIAREPEHSVVARAMGSSLVVAATERTDGGGEGVALTVIALDGGSLLASTTVPGADVAEVLFPRVAVAEGAAPLIIVSWTERNRSEYIAKVRVYDRDLLPRSDVIALDGPINFNPNAIAVGPRGNGGASDELAVFRYVQGSQGNATLDILRCSGL